MQTKRPSAQDKRELRRGWTTGACATAATKAALELLLTGSAPDPVTITLPKGEQPAFALALEAHGLAWARIGIIKDAGDDPDVTHGALIVVTVQRGRAGAGVTFKAGAGVGTITKPGLPLAPGEPAINPVPRRMMQNIVHEVAARHGMAADIAIEIGVPGGERLAAKTWNPRLGIVGGISILGTTGIVHPFSCSAWIHAIHRGIDVARAEGLSRIAGATGSTSQAAAQRRYDLTDSAIIDMGDFVGGMLKYVRAHPIPQVVIAGGFAKMCKFAQGYLDLHSGRSQVDFDWLAAAAAGLGADAALCARIVNANTAAEVLMLCRENHLPIAAEVAAAGFKTAQQTLQGAPVGAEILVVDRNGAVIGEAR